MLWNIQKYYLKLREYNYTFPFINYNCVTCNRGAMPLWFSLQKLLSHMLINFSFFTFSPAVLSRRRGQSCILGLREYIPHRLALGVSAFFQTASWLLLPCLLYQGHPVSNGLSNSFGITFMEESWLDLQTKHNKQTTSLRFLLLLFTSRVIFCPQIPNAIK